MFSSLALHVTTLKFTQISHSCSLLNNILLFSPDTYLKRKERCAPCVSRSADPMMSVNMPVVWTTNDPEPGSSLKVKFCRIYSV